MSSFTTKFAAIAAAFLLAVSSAQAAGSSGFALNSVVGFGGKEWYVIGNGGAGGANLTDTDTLRLLLKADNASAGYGTTLFRESDPYDAIYAGSTLQAKIQGIANNLGRESGVIKESTNGTGDALWALSKSEWDSVTGAANYSSGKGGAEDAIFWLRTPAADGVMYVGNGGPNGHQPNFDYGIRPAFDLDLSSVAFFSNDNTLTTFTFFGEDYANNNLAVSLDINGTFSLEDIDTVFATLNGTVFDDYTTLTATDGSFDVAAFLADRTFEGDGKYTLNLYSAELGGDLFSNFITGTSNVDFWVHNGDVLFAAPPAPPTGETPEPATMLIFGLGLAGLGIARRRMKK